MSKNKKFSFLDTERHVSIRLIIICCIRKRLIRFFLFLNRSREFRVSSNDADCGGEEEELPKFCLRAKHYPVD